MGDLGFYNFPVLIPWIKCALICSEWTVFKFSMLCFQKCIFIFPYFVGDVWTIFIQNVHRSWSVTTPYIWYLYRFSLFLQTYLCNPWSVETNYHPTHKSDAASKRYVWTRSHPDTCTVWHYHTRRSRGLWHSTRNYLMLVVKGMIPLSME